jgi:hypothetical protein
MIGHVVRHYPRRGGVHESLLDRDFIQRGLEIGDVGRQRRLSLIDHRSNAGRRLDFQHDPSCENRKLDEFGKRKRLIGAGYSGHAGSRVGRIGVLAHFTVVDDRQVEGRLSLDDLAHGRCDLRRQRRRGFRPEFALFA